MMTPIYPVFPGVWRIALPWVNVWLLAQGGDAMLVDCGTTYDRGRLLEALAGTLPGGWRVRSILLTHGHCDHAGTAAYFAKEHGARIHAHEREAPYLEPPRRTYVPRGLRAISGSGILFALGEIVFPVRRRAPDALLAGGDRIESPVGTLTVVETPGHTPGHVAYLHEEQGWVFSGDALLNIIPFVRRVGLSLAPPVFSVDMDAARRSARRIADLAPHALLSAHGPPLLVDTADALRKFVTGLP